MYIQTFAPSASTGLTPTIRIRKLSDNSLVVTDLSMQEVGDGLYKYNFTTGISGQEYAIRVDFWSSFTNANSRYRDGYYIESSGSLTMDTVLPTNPADNTVGAALKRTGQATGVVGPSLSYNDFVRDFKKFYEGFDKLEKLIDKHTKLLKKDASSEKEEILGNMSILEERIAEKLTNSIVQVLTSVQENGKSISDTILGDISEKTTKTKEGILQELFAKMSEKEKEQAEREYSSIVDTSIKELEIEFLQETIANIKEENRILQEKLDEQVAKVEAIKEKLA